MRRYFLLTMDDKRWTIAVGYWLMANSGWQSTVIKPYRVDAKILFQKFH